MIQKKKNLPLDHQQRIAVEKIRGSSGIVKILVGNFIDVATNTADALILSEHDATLLHDIALAVQSYFRRQNEKGVYGR